MFLIVATAFVDVTMLETLEGMPENAVLVFDEAALNVDVTSPAVLVVLARTVLVL